MQRPNSLPTEKMLTMFEKNGKKILIGAALVMASVFAVQMHDYVSHANAVVKNVNIQNIDSWNDVLYLIGEKNLTNAEVIQTVSAFQMKDLSNPIIAERVKKIEKIMPPIGLMPNDVLYKDVSFQHKGHTITIEQQDVEAAQKALSIFEHSNQAYEAPSLLSASMIIATYRTTKDINTALTVSEWQYAPIMNNEILVSNSLISAPSKEFLKIIYNAEVHEQSLGL